MEVDRVDGRTPNQLRPLSCSYKLLQRAHGSARWSQGDTTVIAAVYGPKAGTRKNENPEKSAIEVVWKPNFGQIGRDEKENEMAVKRTLQSIVLLIVNPNTTITVVLQESKHLTVTNTRPLTMKDDVLVVVVSPDAKYIAAALLDCTIKGWR
ncbi:hypothetical protein Sjap_026264 [Stephania japonica]|uniref:Exoribonuclease phosphorolytic domain-containing protein n=1 Tax=Stephania japonica TaxID=461633 RepID=A0AAP0EB31_9MAGN